MEVHGYGADVALEGQALTLTATGKIGRGALGTDRREIAIDHLRAVDFQHANPIRNGRLTLVDERGKSIVHFRRKSNDQMVELYNALGELVPEGVLETSTEGAPLFSEDREAVFGPINAWLERKSAEQEEKKRAKEEKKRAKEEPLATPPSSAPDSAAQFCAQCGATVSQPGEQRFCAQCGAPLSH